MEYSPPPLFKQGASARAKVVIFSVMAIVLLMVDARLNALDRVRQLVATALYPLQVVALFPRDAAYMVADYFSTLSSVQKENQALKLRQVADAQTLQQVQQLSAENAHLRELLGATERLPVKSVMGEILYDARDAFTRKIVLNRGTRDGVIAGQPVIDDAGVVGQVTRVFPFTSEVTLLTDKEQAIPVQVVRSGLRSIAYGKGHAGSVDLRFVPVNADIRNGDILVTSGIDGVYPAGLAVAQVVQVETKSSDAFARIICQPLAGIDRNRQLLILLTDTNFPPRPEPEDFKKEKAARKSAADAAKEAPKEAGKEAAKAQPAAPSQGTAPAAAPAASAQKAAPPQSGPAQPPAAPQAQGGAVKAPAPKPAPAAATPAPSASAVAPTAAPKPSAPRNVGPTTSTPDATPTPQQKASTP